MNVGSCDRCRLASSASIPPSASEAAPCFASGSDGKRTGRRGATAQRQPADPRSGGSHCRGRSLFRYTVNATSEAQGLRQLPARRLAEIQERQSTQRRPLAAEAERRITVRAIFVPAARRIPVSTAKLRFAKRSCPLPAQMPAAQRSEHPHCQCPILRDSSAGWTDLRDIRQHCSGAGPTPGPSCADASPSNGKTIRAAARQRPLHERRGRSPSARA